MPEAVIVDAVRTPIGRAFKGSLTQVRPDDMGAFIVDQLLARNEGVDPATVDDLICGCGMTQGEQAYNIGRIIVLLSEKLPDHVTGSTIARYCASSLNAIRIAADSVRAGDGDTYIAAGVESVSRAGPNSEATLPDTQNPKLQGKDGTHNAYIAMGETAENVAERYGDVLCRLAHRDVRVVRAVLALQLRVLRVGQRGLAVGARAAHGLDARRDVGIAVAGAHRVGGDADRVEARGAVARDRGARDVVGQLLRQQHDDAADVVGLLALRHAAAADQVVDRCRVDALVAREQLVDDEGAHVVRPDLCERALEGAPDGRSDGVDDYRFWHVDRLSWRFGEERAGNTRVP